MTVIPSVEMRRILSGLISGCGTGSSSSSSGGGGCNSLCNLTLRLFVNALVVNINSAWSDLVEASFNGYTAHTPITWNPPFTDILGISKVFAGCHQFTATGGLVVQTIQGWALTRQDGGTVLVAAENLAVPVTINGAGQAVIVEPYFPLTTPPA